MTRPTKQGLEQRLNEIDARTTKMVQDIRSRLAKADDTQLDEINQVVTQFEQTQQTVSYGEGGVFGGSSSR